MVTTPLNYVDQNRWRSSGIGGSDHRHCFTGMFILWYEYTNPNTVALVGGRSLGRNKSSGLASSYTCAGSPLLGHRKIRRSTKELGSKTLSERAGIIPKNLTWLRHCAAATARNSFGSHRSVGRAQTHFSSRRANKWSSTSVTLQVQGITLLS